MRVIKTSNVHSFFDLSSLEALTDTFYYLKNKIDASKMNTWFNVVFLYLDTTICQCILQAEANNVLNVLPSLYTTTSQQTLSLVFKMVKQ